MGAMLYPYKNSIHPDGVYPFQNIEIEPLSSLMYRECWHDRIQGVLLIRLCLFSLCYLYGDHCNDT
jgi:hypothetical protein